MTRTTRVSCVDSIVKMALPDPKTTPGELGTHTGTSAVIWWRNSALHWQLRRIQTGLENRSALTGTGVRGTLVRIVLSWPFLVLHIAALCRCQRTVRDWGRHDEDRGHKDRSGTEEQGTRKMGLTRRCAGRRGVVPSPLSSLFLPAFVLVLSAAVPVLVLVLVLETKRNETKRNAPRCRD